MEYTIRINKQLYSSVPLLLRLLGRDCIQEPIRRPGGMSLWQIIIGAAGSGNVIVDSSRQLLRPWDILLLPPGTAHSYENAGDDAHPWIVHFLGFTGSSCQRLMLDMRFHKAGIYHLKSREHCLWHLENFTDILTSEMPDKNRLLSKELYSFLLDISTESFYIETTAGRHDGSLATDIILYLEEHYAEDISLRDLSEHLGKTPEYLCTCFRRETGDTIIRQLTRIRIGHARLLLLESPELSARAVGERCGFRSASYFGKVFKEYTGMTPQNYMMIPGSKA